MLTRPNATPENIVQLATVNEADLTDSQPGRANEASFSDAATSEAAQRLAAIVESSDDVILSKGLDGIITSWNRGAERVFGYTAEEAVGQPVTMLMPPDRVNEESGILARIRRGERIDHYETVRRRKDGTLLDISLTVSPIRDSRGRIIGASKIPRVQTFMP
jgi:PAS domain S-box-containing protein